MATTYEASREVAIHNALVNRISALEFPTKAGSGRATIQAGQVEGSVLLAESQSVTAFPASVTACPLSETWEPSRNCHDVSRRTRWSWDVRVTFNQQVVTDRALEALGSVPIEVAAGVVLRITSVQHTFRPTNDSEQGTALRLTFDSISNH